MDKNCEKIIRVILSDISNEQIVASLSTVSELCTQKMPLKIFDISIEHLAANDYIVLEHFTNGNPCIRPTYKAYNYFENRRKD